MKTKKIIAGVIILLALTTSVFAAKAKKSDKLKVVTTIFPEYDWTREIIGDNASNVELTLLLGNGVDLHSYQPSIQDIAKISTADIFIYVGGESDGWVKDALKNATNKNMKVINLMETLGDKVKAEEVKEGMQAEEEEHEHHHHEEEAEEAAHHHHSVEFKDSDVKDRTLSEFNGEWTSAYVYYKDGALDEAIKFTSEQEPKTDLAALRKCYDQGLKTSIDYINVKGSNVSFTSNGKTTEAKYVYAGYRIVQYAAGNRGVRYFFEVKGKANGCPKYIGFNDHMIAPTKPEHYHFYSSNISIDDMCAESDNWPTYFPKNYSKDEVSKAFAGYNPMAHMSAAADHDHEHDHHHEAEEGHHHHHHDDEDEVEYDEHVWLSLRNAKRLSAEIANALCEKDTANATSYKANLSVFAAKLDALDAKYAAAVKAGSKKTILFGDRFPFRYLVDDYGLDYFAAFVGCSAETEASFETVIFLAKKVDELGLNSVLKIESGDGKIARTIIQNTKKKNARVLTLDSIQSTTAKQAMAGTTYLKIMEENLAVLTEALK